MRGFNEAVRNVNRFLNKIKKDRVAAYSAQSAFYVIMSFIPFVMMLLTLLQYTPLSQEDLMNLLMSVLPEGFQDYVKGMVDSLYNNSTALISGTAIAAVWASGRAVMAIANGLNSIHEIEETRNYFVVRIRATFYTLGLMISLILAMGLLVFGNQLQQFIMSHLKFLQHISGFIINVRTIITLLLLSLMFTVMYTVLPNKKPRITSQIPGAIGAALSWSVFSYMFSVYISYVSNMSAIYGSLTKNVKVMLGLNFCLWRLFVGAEVNLYLEEKESYFI